MKQIYVIILTDKQVFYNLSKVLQLHKAVCQSSVDEPSRIYHLTRFSYICYS